jgi:ribonuclease H / adenosylcobalamin/alpha-ribazole phosphatase
VQEPDGRVVAMVAEGIGIATNNVAEYKAAIAGLERAAELGARSILVRSDSKLLIEQLSGRWRVKNPTLIRLHERVRSLVGRFRGEVAFEHVPRELNREADRLANRGVDEWLAGPGKGYRPPGPAPALFEQDSG